MRLIFRCTFYTRNYGKYSNYFPETAFWVSWSTVVDSEEAGEHSEEEEEEEDGGEEQV